MKDETTGRFSQELNLKGNLWLEVMKQAIMLSYPIQAPLRHHRGKEGRQEQGKELVAAIEEVNRISDKERITMSRSSTVSTIGILYGATQPTLLFHSLVNCTIPGMSWSTT